MPWQWVSLTCSAVLLLFCGVANSQSGYLVQHCTELENRASNALDSGQSETILRAERDLLADCSDLMSKKEQASTLQTIGMELINQRQYDDAIPILQRCGAIYPDKAGCWVLLGNANWELRKRSDAKTCWERAVAIGGFDDANAHAIQAAKRLLLEHSGEFPDAGSKSENTPNESGHSETTHSFGTGFFVNNQGYILTNDHVVTGCRKLADRDGKPLHITYRDVGADLALLKTDTLPSSSAVFRTGPVPKVGDAVVAFGFPLPDILSSEGNISTGVLSATSGLQDDPRFVQISAPVQPGNSGGPLFDSSGHVIGVVVAKLDALKVARVTGDVPQNVNFAVHWAEVRAFLDTQGVRYQKGPSLHISAARDIAATASRISVAIDCTR
jgi:S1-C subfamily serine protease